MRKTVTFALALAFAAQQCAGVAVTGCPAVNLLLHANAVHLGLNCLCLWTLLTGRPWPRGRSVLFGAAAGIAGLWASPWPFTGASGAVFALLGLAVGDWPAGRNLALMALSLGACTLAQPASIVAHGLPALMGMAAGLARFAARERRRHGGR